LLPARGFDDSVAARGRASQRRAASSITMRILRTTLALAAGAALLLGLGGCLTDSPLTSSASTNIDTRLLGVFEYDSGGGRKKDGGDEASEKEILRVAVLPRSEDEYLIYYRDESKKPVETLEFIGWISRVDENYYLAIKDVTGGSSTFGKFSFMKFTWRWPGNIILHAPDQAGLEHASSFQLRKAVRQKLRDDTLFPYEGTYWNKIARVWWDPKAENPATTIPKEFYTGTKRKHPGL
jgi:hypothetical protein